jgi:hypothetical protein
MNRAASRFVEHIIASRGGRVAAAARAGNRALRGGRIVRTGDHLVNVASGMSNIMSKKGFYVPFFLGAAGLGFTRGFAGEVMNSPEGYAAMRDIMGQRQQPSPFGAPLPAYNQYETNPVSYPSWRIPTQDPLKATGELALAMFATRHGR